MGAKRVLKEEKENNENNAECITDNNNGMEALIGTNVEGMIENDVESSRGADQNLEINSRTGNVDKSKIGRNINSDSNTNGCDIILCDLKYDPMPTYLPYNLN